MGALDDAIREHLELKRLHGASDEEIQRAEAEALGPARRGPAAGVEEPGAVDEAAGFDDDHAPYAEEDAPPLASEAALDAPPAPMDAVADAPPPPALDEPEPEPEPVPVDAPAAEPHEAPAPGTPKPHGDPAFDDEHEEPPHADYEPSGGDPDRNRTAILDDPLDELAPIDEQPPLHHEPGPDEPPAPARPQGADPLEPPTAERPAAPAPEPHMGAGPPPADEDVLEETPDFLQETPEHDRLWFEQKPPRDFDFDD